MRHRIRRPVARDAALAFERLDQRGLLAAHVRAGAQVQRHVEVEAALAEDRRAEQALRAAARERLPQRRSEVLVLAAQVDEAVRGADRVRAHRHALDDEVGVAREQHAVLERAGLAFVGVADDVARRPRRRGAGLPLEPGREAGAAAPAQVRAFDLLERCRRALRQRGDAFAPRARVAGLLGLARAAGDRRGERGARRHVGVEQHVAPVDVVGDREELGRPLGQRHLSADQLGHRVDARRRHPRDRAAVDEDRRALVAHAGARRRVDRHETVLRHLATLDPQARAEPVEQRGAACHPVGDVVGEEDAVPAGGGEVQERIEPRHAFDACARQLQPVREERDRRGGQPAFARLRIAQDLHELRRAGAVGGNDGVEPGDARRRKCGIGHHGPC